MPGVSQTVWVVHRIDSRWLTSFLRCIARGRRQAGLQNPTEFSSEVPFFGRTALRFGKKRPARQLQSRSLRRRDDSGATVAKREGPGWQAKGEERARFRIERVQGKERNQQPYANR